MKKGKGVSRLILKEKMLLLMQNCKYHTENQKQYRYSRVARMITIQFTPNTAG